MLTNAASGRRTLSGIGRFSPMPSSLPVGFVRLHICTQNSIDTGLVATLLSEPRQHVRVKPHGDHLFTMRQDDFGVLPETLICRMGIRVSDNAGVDIDITHASQRFPIGAASSLRGFRGFASSSVFHVVLPAMLK